MPGKHLSVEQRALIAGILSKDPEASCVVIGRQVGVSGPTISRELRRDGKDRSSWTAWSAQLDADVRRRRPKRFRVQSCSRLRREVACGLAKQWSPEQITGRLRVDFPHRPELRLSHTAIYRSIYVLGRMKLLTELDQPLRRGGQGPRPRTGTCSYSRIKDATPIGERPAEADDRVPGHWEGDLIKGKNNRSAIATLVERSTRFTILVPLPDGWKADVLAAALAEAVHALPRHLWASLTWDRGTEMARHAEFSIATGINVYFADPYSPWQRPTNENTNGLLRQYLPKDTDLSLVPAQRLTQIQNLINGRPRKLLHFATPAEALDTLLVEAADATTP